MSTVFIIFQYLIPQHLLSRLVGWLAATKVNWLKTFLIQQFADQYSVNMAEAEKEDLGDYACFNDFFCRALKPEARPITDNADTLICPADGVISQAGDIKGNTIFQAKGKFFSTSALLGGDYKLAKQFDRGSFCTIYLSPKDYHRVHMPVSGSLRSMTYIPGKLFSVNPTTVDRVDNLFARNERVVSVFDTDFGPMVVILVGAMIVASIETVWSGEVAPIRKRISTYNYGQSEQIHLQRGEEMGRFKLGSTVILLLPENAAQWLDHISPEQAVCMGESLANRLKK